MIILTKTQIQKLITTTKQYNQPRTRRVGIGGTITDKPDQGETYILFKWLWLTGRKTQDLQKLKIENINFQEYKVYYKNKNSLPLPPYFMLEINRYLNKKGNLNKPKTRVFTLTTRTFQKRFQQTLKNSGLGWVKGIGLHTIRTSHIEYVTAYLKTHKKRFGLTTRIPDVTLYANYLNGNAIEELFANIL
jgi:integrase